MGGDAYTMNGVMGIAMGLSFSKALYGLHVHLLLRGDESSLFDGDCIDVQHSYRVMCILGRLRLGT